MFIFRVFDDPKCLGDIFIKFATQLRAYTNFLNNYLVALSTLERVCLYYNVCIPNIYITFHYIALQSNTI